MKKNAKQIYNQAEQFGVSLEATCVGISIHEWERLMQGATKANKKLVDKIIADNTDGEFDSFIRFYNPYNHLKTQTHLIFIHSEIEHFFKIL